MIEQISIKDYALVKELNLRFKNGFSVMTGETGSGKSVIIDAISLCLGGRSDKDAIYKGSDKSSIGLLISNLTDNQKLTLLRYGIKADRDVAITREIFSDGKSVARINGKTVTLQNLKEFTQTLVDIHGQNEFDSLNDKEQQMQLLDSFGKKSIYSLKQKYSGTYSRYMSVLKQLSEIKVSSSFNTQKEIDLLKFQVSEIETAAIKPGETEKLEEQRKSYLNFEKIQLSINETYDMLYEREGSILSLLDHCIDKIDVATGYKAEIKNWKESLSDCYYTIEDIANEIGKIKSGFDSEGVDIDYIESRMSAIQLIFQKYGNGYEKVEKFKKDATERIKKLENQEIVEKELNETKEKLIDELKKISYEINELRRETATTLEEKVKKELKTLNFRQVAFKINFEEKEDFSSSGNLNCEFLVSFNPGQDLKPLRKVASGGEISRFMLAIKSATAAEDCIDTLIFDEIDTGVSGMSAQLIGEKLATIGKYRQVIAITHLPQIASFADAHYLVTKSIVENNETQIQIYMLNEEERIRELAFMISGIAITDFGLNAAKDLLKRNQEKIKEIGRIKNS